MAKLDGLAWDDFKLVRAITETRSLNGAAERLQVNHSTVFRRLGHLEERLGVQLFERSRLGYEPTSYGEEMSAFAQRMDDDVTTFTRRIAGRSPAPAGELRVTTNDTLITNYLSPIFARFIAAYPEISLDIVVTNRNLNLSKRDADVAIRPTDTPPETLVGRRLATLGWAFYGRKVDFSGDDLLNGFLSGKVDWNGLFSRNWVSLGDTFGNMKVVRFLRESVQPEKIVYRVNTVLGLAEAVEAGIGLGALPCFIADRRPALLRLAEPQPDFSTGLWLLTHADLRHSARVRAFMDFVATEIATDRKLIEGRE